MATMAMTLQEQLEELEIQYDNAEADRDRAEDDLARLTREIDALRQRIADDAEAAGPEPFVEGPHFTGCPCNACPTIYAEKAS